MKLGVARAGLILVLSAWAAFSLLLVWGGLAASQRSAAAHEAMATAVWLPDAVVRFDQSHERLRVPSWKRLEDDKLWAHVWKGHGLDAAFVPELVELTGVTVGDWVEDKRLHPQALEALQQFMQAAEAADQPALVTSAYRSYSQQQAMRKEITRTRGSFYASEFIAEPGHSEHQLGLAVDFSSYSKACQKSFAKCHLTKPTATWLATHAHEYGFVLRYPEGKQAITGVSPESWHFRYLGRELAGFMYRNHLTLEEVMSVLHEARHIPAE